MWYSAGILLFLVFSVCAQETGPIAQTVYGSLEGFSSMDHLNRTYDAFIGVPFAQPPVESLRWARPARLEPWEDVRNATWWGPHCIQDLAILYPVVKFSTNESEDCLYLNVYVPGSLDDAMGKNIPVMLYFYGGGYSFGTAEMYPGEELATTGEVIVVTTNYRIGMMGFLTTADEVAPGNWGLWDAKAAIEWIRENIEFFGGDPNRITIFGQSAGAATVVHSMMSPQTTDLFQRGIALSGYSPHANASNATLWRLARQWDCPINSTQEAIDCLREKPDKELDQSMEGAYSPVIDGYFADDPFVIQTHEESWEEGRGSHIDFMVGYTFHDDAGALGKILGIPFPNDTDADYNIPAEEWFVRWMSSYSFYENTLEIVNTLYDRFPSMNSSDDAIASEANVKVMTDMSNGAHQFYEVEKHAESGGGGATYAYVFSHHQSFLGGFPQWCNGSHMDDIYSVLGETFMRFMRERLLGEFSEEDKTLSRLVMQYYSNFATTGDPNSGPHDIPECYWPEYDITSRQEMLETPTPIIQNQDEEHFNWFLYEFPAMMIPPDGEPGVDWGSMVAQVRKTMMPDPTSTDQDGEDYFEYDY